MNILVDMNLSPFWVPFLAAQGYQAVHWSTVGAANAPDRELMAWALANRHLVLTHDLDFGTLLAMTQAEGPSVLQVRTSLPLPEKVGDWVVRALLQFADVLDAGALVTVDSQTLRVRVLPLVR